MGEQALKGVDATGLPITNTGKHVTMFDVLKPTDIVVIGSQPASVRVFNRDRKPGAHHAVDTPNSAALPGELPIKRLGPHDDRSGDTVLRVWTESDTIEYQCDVPFEIVEVNRAGWKMYDAPDNPFGVGKVKYTARERKSDTDEKPIWVWTSGLLPARANNQQYKMTFRIGGRFIDGELVGGELVDPDVVCGDPPPAP